MIEFLSEENIALHKDYCRTEKHRWSILEKSIPALKGKGLSEIYTMHLSRDVKSEALKLLKEINLHELYFASFVKKGEKRNPKNEKIRSQFGSIDNFLFEAYMYARELSCGFFLVFEEKKKIKFGESSVYKLPNVILALDLCEHAYFLDYRFNRDKYIKSALAYFNENKIV
jgi:superoxide dismutase